VRNNKTSRISVQVRSRSLKHVETIRRVCIVVSAEIENFLAKQKHSGLAWHTDDTTLRAKFEEFGQVEEAVCHGRSQFFAQCTDVILPRS
jgi:hypothetical protein